jgi:hypothetical protein
LLRSEDKEGGADDDQQLDGHGERDFAGERKLEHESFLSAVAGERFDLYHIGDSSALASAPGRAGSIRERASARCRLDFDEDQSPIPKGVRGSAPTIGEGRDQTLMFQRIVLHLARNRDFPAGSAERGYEIIAPLDASGHLDAKAWKRHKASTVVRRFWAGEGDRVGQLAHHVGGASGATWTIDYGPDAPENEEIGYRLDSHRLVENEYVSIRDDSGHSNTFKIAQVRPLLVAAS